MPYSLHRSAIPTFVSLLTSMKAWLDKAAGQGNEAELVVARLAPDMLPLTSQFQIAADTAKGAVARLCGIEAPTMPDTEASFAELKARCDRTIAYLEAADPAAFDAGADREIVITFPNGAGLRFDGVTYLTGFALPNFQFHVVTAYAILRANGVNLGKQDYLAHLAPHMFPPPAAVAG